MTFSELGDSQGSFSSITPSSDLDIDDATLGKLLTEAHREYADYRSPEGVSVIQSSLSVVFDRTGKPVGERDVDQSIGFGVTRNTCSERFQVSCVSMNQTSNTDGASLTEFGVIQTTVRTPRCHDRRAATGNFTPQSPEARRRRVLAPRDASMGTPLNLEADFDATIGAATGVVNPAAA